MMRTTGTMVASALAMTLYFVRSDIAPSRLRDRNDRRRHGEHIEALLRSAGVQARWVECKTSWLWSEALDVIEAPDARCAQAAADVIALAGAEPAA
ncbi:MAG: hypothetical protein E6I87_00895 [Chloroflexi bacterium]|nr:MAG: hypothetical protein E6I87_00895 [Chloroflexota bacterium]